MSMTKEERRIKQREWSRKWYKRNMVERREKDRLYKQGLLTDPEYRAANAHRAREWRKNPVNYARLLRKIWEKNLKKDFDLTVEDYEKMLTQQNGHCALCPATSGSLTKQTRLAVDHDHKTKKNRALLCDRCNRGLGFFSEDPEKLRQAAAYLERHE